MFKINQNPYTLTAGILLGERGLLTLWSHNTAQCVIYDATFAIFKVLYIFKKQKMGLEDFISSIY